MTNFDWNRTGSESHLLPLFLSSFHKTSERHRILFDSRESELNRYRETIVDFEESTGQREEIQVTIWIESKVTLKSDLAMSGTKGRARIL